MILNLQHMEETKILVFEDEWNTIKGSFELANIYAFDSKLKFTVKSRSQDESFESWREKYSIVFVDITLARNTQMDGFNIVKEISDRDLFDLDKVVVMTGNSKVNEKLQEMGIDVGRVKILYKPVAFNALADELKKILNIATTGTNP